MQKSFILSFIGCVCLSGCVSVGETAIRGNRTLYNEAIHDTSNQQLLLNIARAKYLYTPTFLTATEIDGTNTATASVSGGASALSILTGTVGAVTGTASLTDSPITKYQTLSGNELISQVSTPISPESISQLETSDWPFLPLLNLTVERFTPQFLDYYTALDTLELLNRFGAISFVSSSKNKLKIIFHPVGNLHRSAIQRDDNLDESTSCPEYRGMNDRELQALWYYYKRLIPNADHNDVGDIRLSDVNIKQESLAGSKSISIKISSSGDISEKKPTKNSAYEINFTSVTESDAGMAGNPLYTYSAYGALRLAEHDQPIFVAESQQYEKMIVEYNKNHIDHHDMTQGDNHCFSGEYYYIPRDINHDLIMDPMQMQSEIQRQWREQATAVRMLIRKGVDIEKGRTEIRSLGHSTAFIIVVKTRQPIEHPFATVLRDGFWYSIDDDDHVSKRNFLLLNQILTIQAVPSPTPPTQTTISKPS